MEPTETVGSFTYTVLDELSFANRLKFLSNYVETHPLPHFIPPGVSYEEGKAKDFPEVLAKLRVGIQIAGEAEEKRNQLVHSYWLTEPVAGPTGTVLRCKSRVKHKKVHRSSEYVTATTISAIVEEMEKAKLMIFEATERLHFYLNTRSAKIPEPHEPLQ
jgi:hypothetical protein